MATTKDHPLVASAAAKQLGIKAVTLRKYSTMVEKQLADETRFRDTDNGHRQYSAADLATFQAAIDLSEQGVALAEALARTFGTKQPAITVTVPAKSQPKTATTSSTPVAPAPGPSNAELARQQDIIIRRLDSLNTRLNQVLAQLDRQDERAQQQAAKPWWQFWNK